MDKKSLLIWGAVFLIELGFVWYFSVRSEDGDIMDDVNEELLRKGESVDEDSAFSKKEKTKDKVPDLSFSDYNGKTVRLADFSGKPLVINSWAAWCPFCVGEIDDFAQVQKELSDSVTIILIDRAESLSVAKKFTDDLGVGDDLILLLDSRDSFYTTIGGFAMPETLFINSDGTIDFHKRGPMEAAEIKTRIEKLL